MIDLNWTYCWGANLYWEDSLDIEIDINYGLKIGLGACGSSNLSLNSRRDNSGLKDNWGRSACLHWKGSWGLSASICWEDYLNSVWWM